MTYRASEEPANRVATIRIGRARSWWVGMTFALVFVIGGLVITFALRSSYRFRCVRDDDGKGSCTYEEHHLVGFTARRWSADSLRRARVDNRASPINKRYVDHVIIVMDDGEHEIFDAATKADQTLRADQINRFIADASRPELDLEDTDTSLYPLTLFLVGLGLLILWGVNVQYPARRLVLDEVSGTARFERRTWRAWYEDVTMELGKVAAIEGRIASYEPERDAALVEVRAFFRR